MKKIGLIFFLFAAGVGFSSCSDDDPTQLSFEDVYGRPGWDTGVNANYFTFDETRLNNVEIQDLTEEESDDVVFEVKTTGAEAYFFSNKALAATKGQAFRPMRRSGIASLHKSSASATKRQRENR